MPKRTKGRRYPTFEGRQLHEVLGEQRSAQIAQARREGRLKTVDDFTAEQVAAIEARLKRRLAERTCQYLSR